MVVAFQELPNIFADTFLGSCGSQRAHGRCHQVSLKPNSCSAACLSIRVFELYMEARLKALNSSTDCRKAALNLLAYVEGS